jgi:hypothetical protein
MDDRTITAALKRHWDASDANDFEAGHEIYRDDAVLEYPQSGERIRGRHNIQESRWCKRKCGSIHVGPAPLLLCLDINRMSRHNEKVLLPRERR